MKNLRNKDIETKFRNASTIIFIVSIAISAYLINIIRLGIEEQIHNQAKKESLAIYKKINENIKPIKNISAYAINEIEKNMDIKNVSSIIEEINLHKEHSQIRWQNISWSDIKNNVKITKTAKNSQGKISKSRYASLASNFNNQSIKIKHKFKVDLNNKLLDNDEKSIYLISKNLDSDTELTIKFNDSEFKKILSNSNLHCFTDITVQKYGQFAKENLKLISSNDYDGAEIKLYRKSKGNILTEIMMQKIICTIKIHDHSYNILLSSKSFFFFPYKWNQINRTVFLLLIFNLTIFLTIRSIKKNFILPLSHMINNYDLANQYEPNSVGAYKNYKILEYRYICARLEKIRSYEEKVISMSKILAKKDQEFKSIKNSKLDFISHVNHEIRTPLNALSVSAEIIRRQSFGQIHNKKYIEYINHIYNSSKNLKATISNLLEAFQAKEGIIKLNKLPTDISFIISQCIRTIKKKNKHREIEIFEEYNQSHLVNFDRLYGSKAINHILEAIIKIYAESKICLHICTTYEGCNNKIFVATILAKNLRKESISYLRYYITKDHSKSYLSCDSQELSLDIARYLIESHDGILYAKSKDSELEIKLKICIE